MEDLLLDLPRLFSGLLMLSLAFWCIAIGLRSRVLRAFALYLVLRGMLNLLLPLGSEERLASADVVTGYLGYYQIAVPFAAAAFAVRLVHDGPRPKTMLGLLLGVAALEVAYAIDHDLLWGTGGGGAGALRFAISAGTLAYLVIAHVLLRDPTPARAVTAVAFTLFPIFAAVLDSPDVVRSLVADGNASRLFEGGMYYFFRLAALAYGGYLFLRVARLPGRAKWGWVAMAASAVAGILPRLLVPLFPGSTVLQLAAPFNGLVTIAMPIAVAWSLAWHPFFGTGDVRLPALHAATLLGGVWALFLAALVLAFQGVREGAAIVGLVAVALLLFLLVQSKNLGAPEKERFSGESPMPP